MTSPARIYELQQKFDDEVKRLIVSGEKPDSAVEQACQTVGITLAADVKKNIVDVLTYAIAQQDPVIRHKQKVLGARIRGFIREGKSVRTAVKDAQTEENIHLGEAGEKALIEVLEAEREKVKDLRVEVVSAEEYKNLTGDETCIPYHLNGKDGWHCCKCHEHNSRREDACTMCSHPRCGAALAVAQSNGKKH